MKKLLAAAIVAASAASLATAASAQNPNANPNANANANAGVQIEGGLPGNSEFGLGIAAMNHAGQSLGDVESLAEVSSVETIHVDTKAQGNDEAAWTNAMTRNQAEIDALRAGIDANATLKAELDAQGISTDDIIGVDVGADGSVKVYVQ